MKLSRTVAYALRAILELSKAQPGSPVPCRKLAASGGLPERFLLQILRTLVNRGILESVRGLEGGYLLHRELSTISVLEIVEAIEGEIDFSAIGGAEGFEEPARRRLEELFSSITEGVRQQLASVQLSDLESPDRRNVSAASS